jgi:pimeloyl-ACP methyl ester carboxylesterase
MIWFVLGGAVVCLAYLTAYRAHKFTKKAERDTPSIGQFIDVEGIPVHYVKQGSGPTLVMLHGAGGHVKDFTFDHIDRFSKNFTVIAFDRPGHGYTPILAAPGASLAQQAHLIEQALHKLAIKSAIIMGFSYGGSVALHLATHYKELTKGLVLISAVSMPWPGNIHINYRIMSKPVIGTALMVFSTAYFVDTYFQTAYATVFHPRKAPNGYLDHVGVNMSVRSKSFVENARQLNNLRPQVVEQSNLYSKLDIPIELIHGDLDTSVPVQFHAKEFVKIVPHANLVVVEGMGHGTLQLAIPQIETAVYAVSDSLNYL